jgi:hypothetical protein
MREFGKKSLFTNTEKWFNDEHDTRLKGKIDLQFENTIVDYKSSANRKKGFQILSNTNIEYLEKKKSADFDFQSISYISANRKKGLDRELNFVYNFLLSNRKNILDPSHKVEETLTRLKYKPLAFNEFIVSEECYNFFKDKKHKKLLENIEYNNYKNGINELIMSNTDFYDKDTVKEKVQEVFNDLVINKLGFAYKDFNKTMENTFNRDIIIPLGVSLYELRTGKNEVALIFKDDVEKFLKLVIEKISEINKYQNENFPATPAFNSRDVCKKCDFLNICIDNNLWN